MAELWTHAGQMQLKFSLTNFLGMHRNAPKGFGKTDGYELLRVMDMP